MSPFLRWGLLVAMGWGLLLGLASCAPRAPRRPLRDGALRVGVLLLDGVYNSELAAPFDVFQHTVFHTSPGMDVFTVGRSTDPVTTFEGLQVATDYTLESAPPLDVLVVPSGEHNLDSDLEDEELVTWLRERGTSADYLLSVCDGAFLLAEAGLLEGRRVTTYPGDIPALRERHPGLEVVEGVSFVADGPVVTGVGGALSYDPALYLVETLYGAEVAARLARGLVIAWDLETVRHLRVPPENARPSLQPGDRWDAQLTVENAAGERLPLRQVLGGPEVKAVVLCILGGAEAIPVAGRGGIWCEDSFNELPNLRHLWLDYASRGVRFVGVLCPPFFHEARFGFEEGAFDRTDDDPVYVDNRERFVEASEKLRAAGVFPFDVVVYDPRLELLRQHGFKWWQDDQTYGTPTTWILTSELEVASVPFVKNVYESEGRKLRFTVRDMKVVLDSLLGD